MRMTTLESVRNSQKKIKIMVWWYHRKLEAIALLAAGSLLLGQTVLQQVN